MESVVGKDILATQEIYKYENPDHLFSYVSHDLVDLYDMFLIETVEFSCYKNMHTQFYNKISGFLFIKLTIKKKDGTLQVALINNELKWIYIKHLIIILTSDCNNGYQWRLITRNIITHYNEFALCGLALQVKSIFIFGFSKINYNFFNSYPYFIDL